MLVANPQNGKIKIPLKDIFIALGCLLVVVFGVMGTIIVYPFPRTAADFSGQYVNLLSDKAPSLQKSAGTYTQVLPYAGSNRTYLRHLPPSSVVKRPCHRYWLFTEPGKPPK